MGTARDEAAAQGGCSLPRALRKPTRNLAPNTAGNLPTPSPRLSRNDGSTERTAQCTQTLRQPETRCHQVTCLFRAANLAAAAA